MSDNKPLKDDNSENMVRTFTKWQIECLREFMMSTEVTQLGRVDLSGDMIVEYIQNPFDVNSEFKTVTIKGNP